MGWAMGRQRANDWLSEHLQQPTYNQRIIIILTFKTRARLTTLVVGVVTSFGICIFSECALLLLFVLCLFLPSKLGHQQYSRLTKRVSIQWGKLYIVITLSPFVLPSFLTSFRSFLSPSTFIHDSVVVAAVLVVNGLDTSRRSTKKQLRIAHTGLKISLAL